MIDYLKKMLETMGIMPNTEQLATFKQYYELILEWNEKINLTSIVGEHDTVIKHFCDSLVPIDVIPESSMVCDIGSGAGLPAIPLAIMRPDCKFVMLDATGKKVVFLNQVIETLNLTNCGVIKARAEEYVASAREKFDVVTARAVAKLNILSEYALPLVRVGGIFLAYKTDKEELLTGANAIRILGGTVRDGIFAILPDSDYKRYVFIIDKKSHTPIKYPRPAGKPRIAPLM